MEVNPLQCPVVKLNGVFGNRVHTVEFLVTDRVCMSFGIPGLAETIPNLRRSNICMADKEAKDKMTDVLAVIGPDNMIKFIQGTHQVGGM